MNLLPNDDENMLKCISPFAADNDLPVKTPADADDGPDQAMVLKSNSSYRQVWQLKPSPRANQLLKIIAAETYILKLFMRSVRSFLNRKVIEKEYETAKFFELHQPQSILTRSPLGSSPRASLASPLQPGNSTL